ncbi:MAG: hypothetical protein RLZZ253_1639 [Verrucomicrobiota bacterium]|jgi:hypothetical protein
MFLSCMPVILPGLSDLGNWGEIPMPLGTARPRAGFLTHLRYNSLRIYS